MLRLWLGVLVAAACIDTSLRSKASGQEASSLTVELKPVGPEAYEAMVRFFDYDATLPLRPRRVERKDSDGALRQKVVFRGVRSTMSRRVMTSMRNELA